MDDKEIEELTRELKEMGEETKRKYLEHIKENKLERSYENAKKVFAEMRKKSPESQKKAANYLFKIPMHKCSFEEITIRKTLEYMEATGFPRNLTQNTSELDVFEKAEMRRFARKNRNVMEEKRMKIRMARKPKTAEAIKESNNASFEEPSTSCSWEVVRKRRKEVPK